ncbi:MAG: glycosyltransferase family 4 protein [Clostridia bacterium]|nr:glycosyltransferase family 4 protein [Clostridia bacterium]
MPVAWKIVLPMMALDRGGSRYHVEIARGLQAMGHEVEVTVVQGWPVHGKVPGKLTVIPAMAPEFIPRGDVVLPNFWPTVEAAYRSQDAVFIRLCRGFEPLWVPEKKEALATYRLPIPLVTSSRHLRDLVQEWTGRSSVVVPPGVDGAVFRPGRKRSQDTGRPSLFYVARDVGSGYWYKGQDDFWQAVRILREAFPDLELTVACPEPVPLHPPVGARVFRVTDDGLLARLYAEADVFVSSSWFEAFSLPPLEAMACGTAVVTTDSGGVREYAQPGFNCLVVPPKNPEAMARAVESLLRNPELRAQMALNGRVTASAYTWERTWALMERVIQSALRGALPLG